MDFTMRSARALQFGADAGIESIRTPAFLRIAQNLSVDFLSRSMIRDLDPHRVAARASTQSSRQARASSAGSAETEASSRTGASNGSDTQRSMVFRTSAAESPPCMSLI